MQKQGEVFELTKAENERLGQLIIAITAILEKGMKRKKSDAMKFNFNIERSDFDIKTTFDLSRK